MIAPVGEKLLFEHTKFPATRGGGGVITPTTHPLDPPLSVQLASSVLSNFIDPYTEEGRGFLKGGQWRIQGGGDGVDHPPPPPL